MIGEDGADTEEVKARVLAARQTFGMLMRPLHSITAAAVRTKLAVFRAVTLAQAWTLRESDWKRIRVFETQCLRRIVGMRGKKTPEGIRFLSTKTVLGEVERRMEERNIKPLGKSQQRDSGGGGGKYGGWGHEHKCEKYLGRRWKEEQEWGGEPPPVW